MRPCELDWVSHCGLALSGNKVVAPLGDLIWHSCAGPPDPALHVRPKPGGAERPPPVLLVKPDRTLDEVPDRRLDDREPVRAEMIAQEVEAPLDPPDEGLVRVVNFCSWLIREVPTTSAPRPVYLQQPTFKMPMSAFS